MYVWLRFGIQESDLFLLPPPPSHHHFSLFLCIYSTPRDLTLLDKILDIPAPTKQIPSPISNRLLSFFLFDSFCWRGIFGATEYVEYIFDLNETAMSSLKQVYLNLTWSTDNASFVSTLIDRSSSHQSVLQWTELFLSIPSDPFIRIEKLSNFVFNIVESCLLRKWILNSRHRYLFIVITFSKPLEAGPEWITGGDRISLGVTDRINRIWIWNLCIFYWSCLVTYEADQTARMNISKLMGVVKSRNSIVHFWL